MKVLRSGNIEAVDLLVAAEKSACDVGREGDALASPCEKRIVACVEYDTGRDLAF